MSPDPNVAYEIAYRLLPQYAHHGREKLAQLIARTPDRVGELFYMFACKGRDLTPREDHARLFRCHHGTLSSAMAYFALEYPVPAPIDLTGKRLADVMAGPTPVVLAPHFSVVLMPTDANEVQYFVLGQAPMGGGTTLRAVAADRGNYNLGPGPAPTLAAFLGAVEARVMRRDPT